MKRKSLKSVLLMVLLGIISCNDPRTVVTDIVHADGSVTRMIEMKNSENNFKVGDLQVPFDETWLVRDSLEINEKGDTIWVKRAEKTFENIGLINKYYLCDSSYNRGAKRHVEFTRKFKWFNTEYRFAELVDRTMEFGYPVSDFLSNEELNFYYSPASLVDAQKRSEDSLKIKALEDTVRSKTDQWWFKSVVSEWAGEFCRLTEGKTGAELSSESLKMRENDFVRIFHKYDQKFDSLWAAGTILKEMIGEANALRFKNEADSAMNIITGNVFIDFKDYSLRMIMPGNLIGTNGFKDSTQVLLWPVKSDYFLTQQYEMWAESKTTNLWAWIVTGAFLLFVASGMVIRIMNKKRRPV